MLSLLYLASPTLPIGGFAYSQGLAAAVEQGWVTDRQSLRTWLRGVLHHGIGHLDLPVLLRMHSAVSVKNAEELARLDARIQAGRETMELLQEERHLGRALGRLLQGQNLLPPFPLPESSGYVAVFAAASVGLGLAATDACTGFAWSWIENQVAVACKTIPLGQTEAQSVLLGMMPDIHETVRQAPSIKDHELGSSLPGQALAASMHETQYSRMFRS